MAIGYAANLLGYFIGTLSFTFLITRVALKATGTTKRGAFLAFGVGLCIFSTLAWAVAANSPKGNPAFQFFLFNLVALFVWLAYDYTRASDYAPKISPAESHPSSAEDRTKQSGELPRSTWIRRHLDRPLKRIR